MLYKMYIKRKYCLQRNLWKFMPIVNFIQEFQRDKNNIQSLEMMQING